MEHISAEELAVNLLLLYAPHMVVALLVIITVFRREMSCNHCYAEIVDDSIPGGAACAAAMHANQCSSSSSSKGGATWNEEEADAILEGAGRFCSGAHDAVEFFAGLGGSALTIVFWYAMKALQELERNAEHHNSTAIPAENTSKSALVGAAANGSCGSTLRSKPMSRTPFDSLPEDAAVHIMSFLHPKDVVSFATVSQSTNRMVDLPTNETSVAIWKCLWERDFAWIVRSWDIGKSALERSGVEEKSSFGLFGKEFYFRFGLSWQNYVLAGQNTYDQCLVGLHGHIYDLSLFLVSHPGSPETVMSQAGKDATHFFEAINHSMGARRIALTLCVVVDRSAVDQSECGLRPTLQTPAKPDAPPLPVVVVSPSLERIRKPKRIGTLQVILQDHNRREEQIRKQAAARTTDVSQALNGEINIFYDPFCRRWKGWYTNYFLETIFVNEI